MTVFCILIYYITYVYYCFNCSQIAQLLTLCSTLFGFLTGLSGGVKGKVII